MRKVCFVTGTRAEYGLLQGLMEKIKHDPDMTLQIIATCMHLSPEFGLTYQEIERDGFHIDNKVEMLLSSDTPTGPVKNPLSVCQMGLSPSLYCAITARRRSTAGHSLSIEDCWP